MSELISVIRDRPGRVRRVTWRWILVYVSAGAVLLEVLDVFSQRLGLPDRFFIAAAIGLALLLPGVAGAGALRGLSEEDEEASGQAGRRGRREGSRTSLTAGRGPSRRALHVPSDPHPSGADMAELHYRLGRYYEERGESGRAAFHYARSLEYGTVGPTTRTPEVP